MDLFAARQTKKQRFQKVRLGGTNVTSISKKKKLFFVSQAPRWGSLSYLTTRKKAFSKRFVRTSQMIGGAGKTSSKK